MKAEKAILGLSLLALAFIVLHWPGGNSLLILALSSLSMMYFAGGFYFFCDKTIGQQNLPLSIVSGILLSTAPSAILFKLMYWPGAPHMLVASTFPAIVLMVIVYRLKLKAPEALHVYYKNMLIRTTVFAVLCSLMMAIPTTAIIKIRHLNNPELAKLRIQLFEHPENEEYRRQVENYEKRKDSLDFSSEQQNNGK